MAMIAGLLIGALGILIPGANIGMFFLIASSWDPHVAVPFILGAEISFGCFSCLNVINPSALGEGTKTTNAIALLIKSGMGRVVFNHALYGHILGKMICITPCILLVYLLPEIDTNAVKAVSVLVVIGAWMIFCSESEKPIVNLIAVVILGGVGTVMSKWGGASPMFTLASLMYGIPSFFRGKSERVKLGKGGIYERSFRFEYVLVGLMSSFWWGLPNSLLNSLDQEKPINQVTKTFCSSASSSLLGLALLVSGSGMRSAAADTVGTLYSFNKEEGITWIVISVLVSILVFSEGEYLLELYTKLVNSKVVLAINYLMIGVSLVFISVISDTNILALLLVSLSVQGLVKTLRLKQEITLACISLIPVLG